MSNIERFTVDGKECRVYVPEAFAAAPDKVAVYVLAGDDFPEQIPDVVKSLRSGRPYLLLSFSPVSWDHNYTPWPAPALNKKSEAFTGGGPDLLHWLAEKCRPEMCARYGIGAKAESHLLMGYSLGGLTALWAMYESERFGGCASCSGSLWYDGFLPYTLARQPKSDSRIYLSLGKSEEKARNPRMAAVGDATRAIAARLSEMEMVRETTLVWHEGGHFAFVPERMGTALQWLLK